MSDQSNRYDERFDDNYDERFDGRYDGYGNINTGGRGHAIASLTISIIGLLFLLTGMPFVSLILGIIGVVLASGARKKGCNGSMATIGAILSWISIVIGIIITILFFMVFWGILMIGGFWFRGVADAVQATTAATVV